MGSDGEACPADQLLTGYKEEMPERMVLVLDEAASRSEQIVQAVGVEDRWDHGVSVRQVHASHKRAASDALTVWKTKYSTVPTEIQETHLAAVLHLELIRIKNGWGELALAGTLGPQLSPELALGTTLGGKTMTEMSEAQLKMTKPRMAYLLARAREALRAKPAQTPHPWPGQPASGAAARARVGRGILQQQLDKHPLLAPLLHTDVGPQDAEMHAQEPLPGAAKRKSPDTAASPEKQPGRAKSPSV